MSLNVVTTHRSQQKLSFWHTRLTKLQCQKGQLTVSSKLSPSLQSMRSTWTSLEPSQQSLHGSRYMQLLLQAIACQHYVHHGVQRLWCQRTVSYSQKLEAAFDGKNTVAKACLNERKFVLSTSFNSTKTVSMVPSSDSNSMLRMISSQDQASVSDQ